MTETRNATYAHEPLERHGGVVTLHLASDRRQGCPWCQTQNVKSSVKLLREALGKAVQLLVAYNIGQPGLYSEATWREVQRQAATVNLQTYIHDPRAEVAVGSIGRRDA